MKIHIHDKQCSEHVVILWRNIHCINGEMPRSYIVSLHTNQSGLESQLEVLHKKPSVLWLGIEFSCVSWS